MAIVKKLTDAAHGLAANAGSDDYRSEVERLVDAATEWSNHPCEVVLFENAGVWDTTANRWWSDEKIDKFLEWLTNA